MTTTNYGGINRQQDSNPALVKKTSTNTSEHHIYTQGSSSSLFTSDIVDGAVDGRSHAHVQSLKRRTSSVPSLMGGLIEDIEENVDPIQEGDEIELSNVENYKKLGLTKFLIMLLGVGYLFPFSAMTQPVDYWKHLFPGVDMDFYITFVFMTTNLIALTLIVFVLPEISYTSRVVGGFTGQAFALLFVAVSYFFRLDENWNFGIVLGATGLLAIITALLDSACLSLTSRFPVSCQEALQVGIGVSTLIGSVYRILTKLIFPPEKVVNSSLLYFFTGVVTLLMCVFGYYSLLRTPLGRERLGNLDKKKSSGNKDNNAEDDEAEPLLNGVEVNELEGEIDEEVATLTRQERWSVLKKVSGNAVLVLIFFATSLALWPGLIAALPCYSNAKLTGDWWPLILLGIFSVMDTGSRVLVKYRCGLKPSNIWIPVLLRLVLVPCLILNILQIYFNNDVWSVLFTVILGFTNGYIGSLSLLFIIEIVDDREAGYAGSLVSFFLNSGLVLGAIFGLLINTYVVPH